MRNPSRRNRNIGTAKQGHGQNNRLVIPWPCVPLKSFYERLGKYTKHEKTINGHAFVFVVEETRATSFHACSVEDIAHIITHLPVDDYGDLRLVLLRQPKRKEEIVSPVWGRLIYSYEFEDNYGPAIILEAQDCTRISRWQKNLSLDAQTELERLKNDGHAVTFDGRQHSFGLLPTPVRHTQLYRTLLHEFGHYVHYLTLVKRPGHEDEDDEAREKRDNTYFSLPKVEKEAFAHRYADELASLLQQKNIIPFPPL